MSGEASLQRVSLTPTAPHGNIPAQQFPRVLDHVPDTAKNGVYWITTAYPRAVHRGGVIQISAHDATTVRLRFITEA